MMTSVGLTMIVKNEEAVIERAIRSAAPFIKGWVIVDTGSTDKTKEIIAKTFEELGIPGVLFDRPWVNFGHNRTEALMLARDRMEWAIMLDADDTIGGDPLPDVLWTLEGVDGYSLEVRYHGQLARRPQIFKLASGWKYVGAVHETARCSESATVAEIPSTTYMVVRTEGCRSKDPDRFKKDAEMLLMDHLRDPTNDHTLYHLANSCRSAGMIPEAIEFYKKCIALETGWIQAKYMACVNIVWYSPDEAEKLRAAWLAVGMLPDRLEVQYAVAKQTWSPQNQRVAYTLASSSSNRVPDTSGYLVHPELYEWKLDLELALLAFNLSSFKDAYEAAIRCVLSCPVEVRETSIQIARMSATKQK